MNTILITGGRVIDPATGLDEVSDVLIGGSQIVRIGGAAGGTPAAGRVINAEGLIVAPGLIDPHVHLREPGMEEAETIATGTRAAVAGGFTSVCCMPNTSPPIDDESVVEFIYRQAELGGVCRVFPIGAVSRGRQGEELAEIRLMQQAGAVGFSDDGDVVASAGLMSKALRYIKGTGLALMQHCQEPTLTGGASMHAGAVSVQLGLGGWPRIAEEIVIERDVRLNRGIGCRYHVQHLSSVGSVEIVRAARESGQPVTAEVTPHHLLLTDEQIATGPAGVDGRTGPAYWTNAKMNPPLRERSDIEALRAGVADGTISVLATDHAPHAAERKELDFEAAPFGIIGLETALALYVEALVESGAIDWPHLIGLMTIEPARLCGLDRLGLGTLRTGGPADLVLIDPELRWRIGESDLAGKSRNTPFIGRDVRGRALMTFVEGRERYRSGSLDAGRIRGEPEGVTS